MRRDAAMRAKATRRNTHASRFRPLDAERFWQKSCHRLVNGAIAKGLLPSLSSGEYACADCDNVAHEYDHRDYGRPLEVVPVCRSCNKRRGTAIWPAADSFQFKRLNQAS